MYEILFYENANGESQILSFLHELRQKALSSKDARIQHKQIVYYIELLANNGTQLPPNIVKHIDEDIWELRPGNNRVFFFYFKGGKYVLLHSFRKKTQKTPPNEIALAKSERDDWNRRNGDKQ